jgi:hypothetical protein
MKCLVLLLNFILALSAQLSIAAPGVVVLAGGGPEGDIGVTTDWSYPLYAELVKNGDITGDKKTLAKDLGKGEEDCLQNSLNKEIDQLSKDGLESIRKLKCL